MGSWSRHKAGQERHGGAIRHRTVLEEPADGAMRCAAVFTIRLSNRNVANALLFDLVEALFVAGVGITHDPEGGVVG
ncbi:hypothetical protein SAMN05428969_0875 [Devosia sp. YR412]|nr:hypothetical protein SAMN05428969_0875 [Devosia sp. YR412]